jgi:arylsulfatase A-like enzyme
VPPCGRSPRLLLLGLAVLPVALLAAACGSQEEKAAVAAPVPTATPAPPPRPTRGYVLISIDTLRADHLGSYGYERPTSPFFDSLAARGTLFTEAYAQYPSTLVSHMSMFTGLLPREHGVFPPNSILAPEVETFPQVFQRAGFRTAAFTEGGYVSGRFGFRRGFDTFHVRGRQGGRQLASTFRRGVEFLAGLAPDQRFLLFLHTYAVHTPYDAPARYRSMFWQGPRPADAVGGTSRALVDHNLEGGPLSPQAVAHTTALYDAGIRETDEVLGRFFAELSRLRLADDVTVILTSDHGEEMQEHGRFLHTQLYREVMRVPLLVLHPDRREPVRHAGVVQLTDLAPTLYELAALRPQGSPSGRSLAGLLGRAAAPGDGIAWADGEEGERATYQRREGGLQSLHLFAPTSQLAGRRLLFDAPGGELTLQVRAHQVPRRLRVSSEGRELTTVELGDDWQPLRVVLPAGGARVQLSVDGCVRQEARRSDPLCHGFELRGARPHRVELYDLLADPGQRHDLSRREPRATRALLRELLAFRPQARAGAHSAPLDAELEASLQALGYLQ